MSLQAHTLYHVYNQGNNREKIFYNRNNQGHFLKLIRKYLSPYCEILNYCLMPNHYHILIYTQPQALEPIIVGSLTLTALSNSLRLLQSSYAKVINHQQNRSGSLFRQKAKYKCLYTEDSNNQYGIICFHYIHQNPLKANLVQRLEDWEFSSFRDYIGLRQGTLCNITLTTELIGLNIENVYKQSYQMITEDKLRFIK